MGEKTWHHALCILIAIGTYVIIILFTSGAFGHKLGESVRSASVHHQVARAALRSAQTAAPLTQVFRVK